MNENEALRFLCFTYKGAFYQIRGEISIKENLHLV